MSQTELDVDAVYTAESVQAPDPKATSTGMSMDVERVVPKKVNVPAGVQSQFDELHNLAGLMDRVIVVSHQEDFQDRTLFPTGYVLRKTGQQTEVERFV